MMVRYLFLENPTGRTHCFLVNIVIFLAPMSGFDQMLAEDGSVNRLVRYVPQLASRPTNPLSDRFPTAMANNLQQ